jgi:hypothetical protein
MVATAASAKVEWANAPRPPTLKVRIQRDRPPSTSQAEASGAPTASVNSDRFGGGRKIHDVRKTRTRLATSRRIRMTVTIKGECTRVASRVLPDAASVSVRCERNHDVFNAEPAETAEIP